MDEDDLESTDTTVEQNVFASLTTTSALVSVTLNAMVLAVQLLWQDHRLQRGRLLMPLTVTNMMFAITWVVYGASHFSDENFLTRHEQRGNCTVTAFNFGLLMTVTLYELSLLCVAHYYCYQQDQMPRSYEWAIHAVAAIFLVSSTIPVGISCADRCKTCTTMVCEDSCSQVYVTASTVFIAFICLATILAVWLFVRIHVLKKEWKTNEAYLKGSRSRQYRTKKLKLLNIKRDVVLEMVEPLRWFPAGFLVLSVMTAACAAASDANTTVFETDTARRMLLRFTWWLYSVKPSIHAMVYFLISDHRTRLQWREVKSRLLQMHDERNRLRAHFEGAKVLVYSLPTSAAPSANASEDEEGDGDLGRQRPTRRAHHGRRGSFDGVALPACQDSNDTEPDTDGEDLGDTQLARRVRAGRSPLTIAAAQRQTQFGGSGIEPAGSAAGGAGRGWGPGESGTEDDDDDDVGDFGEDEAEDDAEETEEDYSNGNVEAFVLRQLFDQTRLPQPPGFGRTTFDVQTGREMRVVATDGPAHPHQSQQRQPQQQQSQSQPAKPQGKQKQKQDKRQGLSLRWWRKDSTGSSSAASSIKEADTPTLQKSFTGNSMSSAGDDPPDTPLSLVRTAAASAAAPTAAAPPSRGDSGAVYADHRRFVMADLPNHSPYATQATAAADTSGQPPRRQSAQRSESVV